MATVYKVELTSHWVNYTEEQLKNKIEELFKLDEENLNEVTVDEVERK